MVFVSDSFLFLFLPIFLLVYFCIPQAARNGWILIASWLFYAWWRPEFLLLLIAISFWSWATGLWLARTDGKKAKLALAVAIAGPLLALCWFKYLNLMVGTFVDLGLYNGSWSSIILPIGLSFFVFGAISYSVDVYRKTTPPERNLIDYAAYQSMFGHLVAGPIVRYVSISKRLKHRVFNLVEFTLGIERFMLGFAMKVLIADTLAPLVDYRFHLAAPDFADAWLAVIGYTLQIYFDFAGYSHMAIGLGLMIGLRFPENFNNPYLSSSVIDFWRRWHISLSTWLRDYLYIPLGGNRKGASRTVLNIVITMGLGGLWHGANWTFLVWGLWHATGLIIARTWNVAMPAKIPYWISQPLTLVFVMVGWVLFRAENWGIARSVLKGMMGMNGFPASASSSVGVRPIEGLTLLTGIFFIYLPLLYNFTTSHIANRLWSWTIFAAFLFAVLILQGRAVVPFLYFQF